MRDGHRTTGSSTREVVSRAGQEREYRNRGARLGVADDFTPRRTQETQVLQAIIAVHLNPYAFDWELVDSLELSETRVPRLLHSSRKYWFLFDVKDPDGYFLVFRPGVNQEESTELVGGWLGMIPHVQA